jgi:tetratricopeptide (TPR) repeat protein
MKRLYPYLVAGSLMVGGWGCKQFKGLTTGVTPNPLEVHADSLDFTVKAQIPPKSGIKKKDAFNGDLVIKNGGQRFAMRKFTVSGAQYPDIKKKGANMDPMRVRAAFDKNMDGGNLFVEGTLVRGKKTYKGDSLLAPCCITTSKLVCDEDYFISSDYTYEQQRPFEENAEFNFPQNVSDLNAGQSGDAAFKKILSYLDKKYLVSQAALGGFASPEGPYKRNLVLSAERYKNAQNWLVNELQKRGYKVQLDSAFFAQPVIVTEDWDSFINNFMNTPVTGIDQNQKLRVKEIFDKYKTRLTDNKGNANDKSYNMMEAEIGAVIGDWKKVEVILAPLRRAPLKVTGLTARHSDKQIDSIAAGFLAGSINQATLGSEFSPEEFLYSVERTKSAADARKLLKAFIAIYPQDFRSHNELGILELRENNVQEALDHLNIANQKSPNNYAVKNNLGVAYKKAGDMAEATKQFEASFSLRNTEEAAFNLGVVYQKSAQYNMAADQFERAKNLGCASYNAGLSKLLAKNYPSAKADLNNAVKAESNRALNFYVLAVLGARTDDVNMLLANLKRAVQLDKALSLKATNDLEFRKYFKNPEFQSAATP